MMENKEISKRFTNASIRFVKAISEEYGTEKSHEIWEAMSELIDPNLKMAVFGAMLNGEGEDIVLIDHGPQKINVIKCIRQYLDVGLKEAKDISEMPAAGRPFTINTDRLTENAVSRFRKELVLSGATID